MRKVIIIVIIVICIFSLFLKREIIVLDSRNNSPIPYASIVLSHSRVVADVNGRVSFISSIFQRRIKIQRIGFIEKGILLPFRFYYSKNKVFMEKADYPGIKKQISSVLQEMHSYTYSYDLSVTSKEGNIQTQAVQATYDGHNFIFDNRSDFTGVNYKILYKNGHLYLWKNDSFQLLQGEDEDKFTSKNILFIQISDIVTSLLPDKTPSDILADKNIVHIIWNGETGNTDLLIKVDKNGFPVDFSFNNKSKGNIYTVQLKIEHINEQISVRQ